MREKSGNDQLSGAVSGHLTVNLIALVANWRFLADKVAPAECAGVIKADAYGIGLEPAMAALARAGCRTFFVAHVSEGVRARGVSKTANIFILNGLATDSEAVYAKYSLVPVLGSWLELRRWAAFCQTYQPLPAALHFNTGMNRHGFEASDIDDILAGELNFPLRLVMSHLSSSENPQAPENAVQTALFEQIRAQFLEIPGSLANSSGVFLCSKPFFSLVRPGFALYGGNPQPGLTNPMQRVVSLTAPIIQVREVAAGVAVGYNGLWTTKRPSRLATLNIGYADGLPRSARGTDAKPGANAYIRGVVCPFVGAISMDMSVIDVTTVTDVSAGMDVEILGPHQSVDQLGEACGTIGYEILTRLGQRFFRTYLD